MRFYHKYLHIVRTCGMLKQIMHREAFGMWDFDVRRRDSDEWYMEKPHFHEQLEFLLPLSCGGRLFADRQSWPLRRGVLFYLGEGALHRSFGRGGRGYSRYVLHVPRRTLERLQAPQLASLLSDPGCVSLSPEQFALCRRLLSDMASQQAGEGALLRRRAAFLAFLAFVHTLPLPSPAPGAGGGAGDDAVHRVLCYVRENLRGDLSLDELARRHFMSKSTLCRRFKAATGFSVGEYVICCRVQRARTLLRQGLSVQRAGEEAGFGDNAHFIRTFKRLSGMPPGRYAKAARAAAGKGETFHEQLLH